MIQLHVPALQAVPYGPHFILVILLAVQYGYLPSVIATVLSLLSRGLFRSAMGLSPVLDRGDLARIIVVLAAALLISFLTRSRRRAAQSLQSAHAELQERTEALIDTLRSSRCASWVFDLESGQIRWFRGSYQVYGRAFDDLSSPTTLAAVLSPEDRQRVPALLEQMRTAQDPLVFEHSALWPDGETHWLEMRATRVPGEALLWRGVTLDITERKLAETLLLRSEKLAAMGRLASTVAHEINNPLESVTNLLFLVGSDSTLSPTTRSYLDTAEQELARLGDITRLTLGFVRTNDSRRRLELGPVVDEVLAIFRRRFEARDIQLVYEYETSPGLCVHMAAHELRQIFTNLVSNAADAISPQAHTADPLEALMRGPAGVVRLRILAKNTVAVITLEDTGSGIPPEVLPRIFEPFFTTKQDVGTGIGLWVTRELVEANGGTITVQSGELSEGFRTRFQIDLPLAPAL